MNTFVISENPLFGEVLTATANRAFGGDVESLSPDAALIRISTCIPDCILIDEMIPGEKLEPLLVAVKNINNCRVLLVNPKNNDFMYLGADKVTLRKVEDLMKIDISDREEVKSKDDFLKRAKHADSMAGIYQFLAGMINERPGIDFVRRMRESGCEAFLEIAMGNTFSDEIDQGLQFMARFIEETSLIDEKNLAASLTVEWTRLFRGIREGYASPPPYESLYTGGKAEVIHVLQSVQQWYQRLGAAFGESCTNRPDYLGVELDFLYFLSMQEAEAWERSEQDKAEYISSQAQRFFVEHPGRWAEKFCRITEQYANTDFYRGLLRLCSGVMKEIEKK